MRQWAELESSQAAKLKVLAEQTDSSGDKGFALGHSAASAIRAGPGGEGGQEAAARGRARPGGGAPAAGFWGLGPAARARPPASPRPSAGRNPVARVRDFRGAPPGTPRPPRPAQWKGRRDPAAARGRCSAPQRPGGRTPRPPRRRGDTRGPARGAPGGVRPPALQPQMGNSCLVM
ncbi:translation initiation factor IF-2-like [Cebus imitator]|uniref:translation initiation factor IF-2-like n=1 Tax=Cebus imitator TaxID=2715852 RepID=UPI00189B9647|nr:translation initiation factor IF-2-like [Cebus imitator]